MKVINLGKLEILSTRTLDYSLAQKTVISAWKAAAEVEANVAVTVYAK